MGIYISNIEMPATCGKCTLKSAIECEKWKHVRSVVLDRHRDCPLIPVPPHGDLIDRNKLLNGDGVYLISFQKSGIDTMKIIKAPTIIPAEEGET